MLDKQLNHLETQLKLVIDALEMHELQSQTAHFLINMKGCRPPYLEEHHKDFEKWIRNGHQMIPHYKNEIQKLTQEIKDLKAFLEIQKVKVA